MRIPGVSPLMIVAMAASCGTGDEAGETDGLGGSGDSRGTSGPASPNDGFSINGGAGAGGSGSGSLPPEVEVDIEFELPRAGENFVYVANPESDTVAVIDAETLTIQTVEAGDEPTFLQTLASRDQAIVLNVGSDDATIIRTEPAGSTTTKVDVLPGSNAIAVAPDGRHAVVYFDADLRSAGNLSGSFQDVTVVRMGEGGDQSVGMSVGFRPIDVFFSADSSRAFVVTEDGVSILDFAEIADSGPGIAPLVPVGETGIDQTLDVSITPDGRFALAREQGDSTLRLVDLDSGDIELLKLSDFVPQPRIDAGAPAPDGGGEPEPGAPEGGAGDAAGSADAGPSSAPDAGAESPANSNVPVAVTDLDLSPSGDFAMAVLRDESTVLRIPVPGAFDDPSGIEATRIEGELIGSVVLSQDEQFALLFTTASTAVERLTILELAAGEYRPVQLRKAIRSVVVSPDAETALVVHNNVGGNPFEPGLDPDVAVDRSFGYSVVRLDTGFAKLQTTAADLGPFTIVPDGTFLFILFNAEGLREVQRVDLDSFLVRSISLGSPPISIGAVPGSERVFVGQEHPDGRISFIDWVSADLKSVTGFELNSRIRE